jgi:hypothetical protein
MMPALTLRPPAPTADKKPTGAIIEARRYGHHEAIGGVMAAASIVRIGTCSWAEKLLIASGEFYPKGVYNWEELDSFARVAKELSATARLVYLMFNNCRAGHAMKNAMELARLI